jgi:SAM-dependent methyltransferase
MQNELTDRDYWSQYWSNYQYEKIPSKTIYDKYIPALKEKESFIEIGGFPGINAAYFYKNVCKDVTLLDFYVNQAIVSKFEQINQLPEGSIHCIESDFFKFDSNRTYDIVFSFGFIEHFDDTRDVIERHTKLLSEHGQLLIILPNLRGLNGCIQWLFDRKNLRAHNLESMKIDLLKDIMKKTGMKSWKIDYTRKPMVWLEPKPGILNKTGRTLIKLFSYSIKIFPIKGWLLSPYIIITAQK